MSGVHWDNGGLLKWCHDPWSSSQVSSGNSLLLRCDGNTGITSPMKQGNGPTSQREDGEPGLFVSCDGTFGVPLECRRGCRGLLELPQGCQGPFWSSEGKVGFLSRHSSGQGPQLLLRGKSAGSSRVTMGISANRSWGLREVQSPRESGGAPRDSSAVAAPAKVLIWS